MPSPLDALKPLAGRALEAALNRAAALDPDTLAALAQLDGRSVSLTLESPPLALEIRVHDQYLQVGPPLREADLAVRGTIGGLLRQVPFLAAAASGRPSGRLHVSGDADLARRLQKLASGFEPDWQQPFVDVFGPVLGVQLANAAGAALRGARGLAGGLGRGAGPGRRPGPLRRRVRDRGIARRGRSRRAGRVQRRRGRDPRRRRTPGRAHRPPARAWGGVVRAALRAWRIARVVLRYRLDALLDGTPAERWLRLGRPFVPRASADIASQPRGMRLRLALQELGPIFVKFGQILSTRRDLLPPDIAEELAMLQDQVAPFDGQAAQAIVEQALGRPVEAAFAAFDTRPLASASIAQVHAARLHDGREVVVKVLRPGIERQIDADIALLRSLAAVVDRAHPRADRIRPQAVVAEIETTLAAELDLQREGANASVMRRFWKDSPDMYVPGVIWSHTAQRALTMERVHGIPSDDIAALDAAGIDRSVLAAKGVRVFYTQVFRD